MPGLPEGVVVWVTYYTSDTVCESYYVTLRKSKTLVYIVSEVKAKCILKPWCFNALMSR